MKDATAGLSDVLDTLTGLRWLTTGIKAGERRAAESPVVAALRQQPENSFDLLAHGQAAVDTGTGVGTVALDPEFTNLLNESKAVASDERFLHWEAAFPGVWQQWLNDAPVGGFDAVIGNPPWDRIKLQEVEWFATRSPELALAPTAAARRSGIRRLREEDSPLADQFDAAKGRADRLGGMIRSCGYYPLLGGGDVNLYSLFVERAMELVKPDGMVGLLTPSGIYADRSASKFFRTISTSGRIGGLFDFENRKVFFPDVHASFKFCALIFGGPDRRFDETRCSFFLHDTATINDPERCFPLTPEDFTLVNPNTSTAPIFRTRRDADITRRIYEEHPVLVNRSQGEERSVWPVRYRTMFHMTNDSHLFHTAAQLEADGFYPVEGNRWRKGEEVYLPLYEGKMVQAFDHRAASVVVNPNNLNRPAQTLGALPEEHSDPTWLPKPQFWVVDSALNWPWSPDWAVGFKEITSPTNRRTMISCLFPKATFGNKLPLLLPVLGEPAEAASSYKESAPLLVATLNSMAFDFIARQKLQGQTLNLYILEQLPVIPPDAYGRRFGATTARDVVLDHVLRLTYTANDMIPLARDLGYEGPPFIWDEEERRHLRARLDALYFHLYGVSRDDADYVLSTFPIVQREDEAEFGTYRTRDLVLAYMNALAAGDAESVIDL